MTNSEYIRATLRDNDLALILSQISTSKFNIDTLYNANKVFEYWSSKEYTVPAKNFYENMEELKSQASTLGYWETLRLYDSNKWIRYGRTKQQGINLWLSLQYDEEYWNKAIEEYNKRWED